MTLRIARHPSPNFGARRDGLTPEFIVLHYTAMASATAAIHRLCDPQAEVSAHYVISRQGAVTQLVEDDMRAWHAGAGSWRGLDDLNSRSIGIELDNAGTHPFAEPQMQALEELLVRVMARWQIGPEGVIGHSDLAPGRKIDPGPHFDWARLQWLGLAARTPDRAAYTSGSLAEQEAAFALRWAHSLRVMGSDPQHGSPANRH